MDYDLNLNLGSERVQAIHNMKKPTQQNRKFRSTFIVQTLIVCRWKLHIHDVHTVGVRSKEIVPKFRTYVEDKKFWVHVDVFWGFFFGLCLSKFRNLVQCPIIVITVWCIISFCLVFHHIIFWPVIVTKNADRRRSQKVRNRSLLIFVWNILILLYGIIITCDVIKTK